MAGLILIVRPVAIWLSTIGSELDWRERTFLAFLAPRGIVAAAVSAVFALHVAGHVAHLTDAHPPAETHEQTAVDRPTSIGGAPAAPTPPENEVPLGTDMIVPITFLVIVGTVAFYGLLAAPLARFLGLSEPNSGESA